MDYLDYENKMHVIELQKLKNEIDYNTEKRFEEIYIILKAFVLSLELDKKSREKIIEELKKDFGNKIVPILNDIKNEMSKTSVELAIYELTFQQKLINKVVDKKILFDKINKETAKVLVFDNPVQGELFKDTFQKNGNDFYESVKKAITIGITNKERPQHIYKLVESQTNLSQSKLKSLTSTIVTNVSNLAQEETYKKSKLIEKYQYVATMDNRTTEICRKLNGEIFEVGKGKLPPQHFNCRCCTIPILKIDNEDIVENINYTEEQFKKDINTKKRKTLNQLKEEL